MTYSYPHSVPTLGSGPFVLEIVFVQDRNPDCVDLDMFSWYYMRGKTGGIPQDLCAAPFDKVSYIPGEAFPALPPDDDFGDREIFDGYKNCRYQAGNPGVPSPGSVTCAKTGTFLCDSEPGTTSPLHCGSGESRTPTVKCIFPTI